MSPAEEEITRVAFAAVFGKTIGVLILYPKILYCPYCGGKKEIFDCLSGNTIGAIQWSDGKLIAPMLQEVSPLQECPFCRKYYFVEDGEEAPTLSLPPLDTEEDGDADIYGNLTFEKSRKAYEQLIAEESRRKESKENTTTRGKRRRLSVGNMVDLLFAVIFAYNDAHGRAGVATDVKSEDFAFFKKCVGELLHKYPRRVCPIMRAEFRREMGMFDFCIELLDAVNPRRKFEKLLISQIRAYALEKKTDVFAINPD